MKPATCRGQEAEIEELGLCFYDHSGRKELGKRLYLHLKEKKKNLKLEVAKRNVLKKEIGEKFLSPFCT